MLIGENLNGCRLYIQGDPNVWLVFHNQRHRISSPRVYNSLFSEISGLLESPDLKELPEGYELGEGTCLVQGDETIARFLVVKTTEGVRRLHVSSWEAWQSFAFNENALWRLPEMIINEIKLGDPLC